ncbi:MAG: undecaprenyldiphospho-muramoylpentapeptide beta-N-acetylglucosaminyltransferase [Candidatus Improbicoccus pseudotrichonymphae]|uniref:UDP-N-acetylglucosamine--N-acetylmuramyl-(pentapeptide) pyrophosphoryl-undecaprenol N-acetylglucosamine transferase n=1 Tax=Candidatus Improbicoccus pseudotrichonymphae TaxID=3033792 RepID=A0AA48HY03_9FIRM|nr:MAG: undecaprenyldiphospho-muramoylpentapeptide beta-N-acetylglucosaminyltransferase [Candidatus Improbicoccus pseudotrichonymphae]
MRIIFVGGGTSGHINPALNMASYLKKIEPDSQILYIGSKNGLEKELSKKAKVDFKSINVSGFLRKFSLRATYKNLISCLKILISDMESKKILKDFNPDICMGTGGYVCGPFLRRAYKMNIPFVIHEQNSIPGLTTKLLAKKASKIMLAMPDIKECLPKEKVELVGNPLKSTFLEKNQAIKMINEKYGKNLINKKIVLSFGGSLGSGAINSVILKIIKEGIFFHIHAYGRNGKKIFKNLDKIENLSKFLIREYIYDMDICMAAADVIICRSGSMTISEIISLRKPAILIPSPNVANNHQYFNALFLSESDAATMIEEKNLTMENLKSKINEILNDKNIRKRYAENLKKISTTNTNEKIHEILKFYSKKTRIVLDRG